MNTGLDMNYINSHYYTISGKKIFCTLIGDLSANKECTIYFAPLFEERMWSQRIAFNFACSLWEHTGQPVIFYDYYGYGESDGDSEDFTVERCMNDFKMLMAILEDEYKVEKISLWGIRTGCLLALMSSKNNNNINSLCLWFPVLNIKDYIYRELRGAISFQTSIFKKVILNRKVILSELIEKGKSECQGYLMNNIEGYLFGRIFYEEALKIDNNFLENINNRPLLILDTIQPSKNRGEGQSKDSKYSSYIENENITIREIKVNPFWQYSRDYTQRLDDIFKITIDWNRNININNENTE